MPVQIRAGDVFALNDPYHGGTHLPDVTVVTPVFDAAGSRILFFVGSRGHHADIGGMTPGSMPPFSTRIEQEGVQIDNFRLVDAGRLREDEILALLRSGELSGAQSAAEPGRPEGADRRQRTRRAGAAPHGRRSTASRSCTPTCSMCRTTPRSRCGASSPG